MDRKMDVGMAPPEGEPAHKSTAALIAEGRAPLDLSDADAVYVFDALLACEATWHGGQALATTVYTCLYMHDWERLEAARSPVVRAYFEAVRCSCASVRYAVSAADIYEEEDFILATSGFDMGFAAVGDPERRDVALAGLRAAETWLLERDGSDDGGGGGDCDVLDGDSVSDTAAAAAAALLTRVRFRIALHTAMVHLFQRPNGDDAAAARQCLDQATTYLADMRADLARVPPPKREVGAGRGEENGDASGKSQSEAAGSDESERLKVESESKGGAGEGANSGGGAVDGGEALGGGALDWDPSGLGFDRKVNLTKMGPAPPRVVKLHTRAAAIDHFAGLVRQLRRVCDVAGLYQAGVRSAQRGQTLNPGKKTLNRKPHEPQTLSTKP
jgi:hypothetical protein